jgi:hypothetical protein
MNNLGLPDRCGSEAQSRALPKIRLTRSARAARERAGTAERFFRALPPVSLRG